MIKKVNTNEVIPRIGVSRSTTVRRSTESIKKKDK